MVGVKDIIQKEITGSILQIHFFPQVAEELRPLQAPCGDPGAADLPYVREGHLEKDRAAKSLPAGQPRNA